jgi:hypothetical protein
MTNSVKSLKDLFSLTLSNPSLAKRLKANPIEVAELFGLKLSKEDAEKISSNLKVDEILKQATDVDGMAAKVAQGVGIKNI